MQHISLSQEHSVWTEGAQLNRFHYDRTDFYQILIDSGSSVIKAVAWKSLNSPSAKRKRGKTKRRLSELEITFLEMLLQS